MDLKDRQNQLLEQIKTQSRNRDAAIMELVSLNMGHLHKEASRMGTPDEHEDLVSEGIYGLLEAISSYDGTKGVAFLTYAYPFIKHRMSEYMRSLYAVKISKWGRRHLDGEQLGIYRTALDMDEVRETISGINEAQGNEGYNAVEETEMMRAVREAIDKLPEREAVAVRGRYGIGGPRRAMKDMARELGVSNSMMTRYLEYGLDKLKKNPRLKAFADCL